MDRPDRYKGKFNEQTYPYDRVNLVYQIERRWRNGEQRYKPVEGVSLPVFWEHGKMSHNYFQKLKRDVEPYMKAAFGDDFKMVLDVGDYFTVISLDFEGY